jgi:hypothetical protein
VQATGTAGGYDLSRKIPPARAASAIFLHFNIYRQKRAKKPQKIHIFATTISKIYGMLYP